MGEGGQGCRINWQTWVRCRCCAPRPFFFFFCDKKEMGGRREVTAIYAYTLAPIRLRHARGLQMRFLFARQTMDRVCRRRHWSKLRDCCCCYYIVYGRKGYSSRFPGCVPVEKGQWRRICHVSVSCVGIRSNWFGRWDV